MFGYTGSIAVIDPKGLAGPVSIQDAHGTDVDRLACPEGHWRGRRQDRAAERRGGWAGRTTRSADDAFGHQHGYAWFQTTIPATVGASYASLRFGGVDDNGTVFINGKQVATHRGWDSAFDVPVPPGPAAVVTVFVENVDGTGGLNKPATLVARTGQPVVASGWKLRGGPGDPLSPSGWKRLPPADAFPRSRLLPHDLRRLAARRRPARTPIWRVVTTGLGHGSVWVNGHNLGRYPEKIPSQRPVRPRVLGSKPGRNSLVIYDEDGHRPDQVVTVAAEAAASRDVVVLTSKE